MIPPSYKPLMDYCSAFYHLNILVGNFPPHNKRNHLQTIWILEPFLKIQFFHLPPRFIINHLHLCYIHQNDNQIFNSQLMSFCFFGAAEVQGVICPPPGCQALEQCGGSPSFLARFNRNLDVSKYIFLHTVQTL